MASADGRESLGVSHTLLDSPYHFDFFQAVRVLEYRRRERRGGSDPTSSPVGHDDEATEPVRFRARVSLSFPAASISELRDSPARRGHAPGPAAPEMTVTFFGL